MAAPKYITFFFSWRSCCSQTLEGIWNNYIDMEQQVVQVIFIIFLSTWGYNSLGDTTRQHEVWKKILLQCDPIERLTACVLRWTPNLMLKWPKWNEITWRILLWNIRNSLLNFPGNQGLAIKSKRIEIIIFYFLCHSTAEGEGEGDIFLKFRIQFSFCDNLTLEIIASISPKHL